MTRSGYSERFQPGPHQSAATARGFRVIDTEPHFIAAYAADRQRFERLTDSHWNAHGHEVVATAVLDELADWPPLAKR